MFARIGGDHRAFAVDELLAGFVATTKQAEVVGLAPRRHHGDVLDLRQAVEGQRPLAGDGRHAGHGADVIDVHPDRPRGGVWAGVASILQLVEDALHLEPRLRRLLRVEFGLAQGILVVEEDRGGVDQRQRDQAALAIDHAGFQIGRQIGHLQRLAGLGHHVLQGNECLRLRQHFAHVVAAHQVQACRLATLFDAGKFQVAAVFLVEAVDHRLQLRFALRPKVMRQFEIGRRLNGSLLCGRLCRRFGSQHRRTGKNQRHGDD